MVQLEQDAENKEASPLIRSKMKDKMRDFTRNYCVEVTQKYKKQASFLLVTVSFFS